MTDACDLVVVGSGAGGLTAAVVAARLGLSVAVLEKAGRFGGTTAWSGGWLWVPGNPLAREAGIAEAPGAPMRYLRSVMGPAADEDPRIARYLETAPEMVDWLRRHGAMEWIDGNSVPDFRDLDGAVAGGRSVCARPVDGRSLGPLIDRLRPPLGVISLAGMGLAAGADMRHFFNATRRPASLLHVARRLARHGRDLLRHRRAMQLVGGNALAARLLRAASEAGVDLRAGTGVADLLRDGARVTGVRLEDGRELRAARGVVLATGGFPHAPDLQERLFAPAAARGHRSAAPRENTGAGLRMAERAGARLRSDLVHGGAWAPVSLVPDGQGGHYHFPHLVDRARPGIIAVRGAGERFCNEAGSYHAFMSALFEATPEGAAAECWLIADHRAQRRWGLGWSKPFPFPLAPYRRAGYLVSGRTPAELAARCGLDGEVLTATIARFNAAAQRGDDPYFGRGRNRYDRVQGDPERRPNPTLGPLERGPFHAVRLVPGSLGTFAGLDCDAEARVRDAAGRPIPGLFAAGNDMASIFGGHYPSGGITLGPAMTFGFIAAHAAARRDGAAPATANASGDLHETV
ncbi:MAG: FAD-dependent oxidoreductase [Limimaricola soesokkakensis]